MTTTTTNETTPRVEANRLNAQLSTGPRTEEGKARSAQNARTHGLTSDQLYIANAAEAEVLTSLRAALTAELAPIGELEHTQFDTLLHAQWNIRRCRALEAGYLADFEQNEAKLRNLDRHARRHEANYHRALTQLRALQTERHFRELAATSPAQPVLAPPSSIANSLTARRAALHDAGTRQRLANTELSQALDRAFLRRASSTASNRPA